MEMLVNVRREERRVINSTSFRINISFGTFLKVKLSIFRVRGLHECYTVEALPEQREVGREFEV